MCTLPLQIQQSNKSPLTSDQLEFLKQTLSQNFQYGSNMAILIMHLGKEGWSMADIANIPESINNSRNSGLGVLHYGDMSLSNTLIYVR